MRQYILASGSPRRIEMMAAHGIQPIICPASIEENLPLFHGMTETVTYLALKKAKDVETRWQSGQLQAVQPSDPASAAASAPDTEKPPIIIAADTVVYLDEIMGKPVDKADGMRMLRALRGTFHYVVTGVALVEAGAMNARVFYEVTKVYFKDYSDEALSAYLDTDEAYDKAGGYAIQGYFSRYIDHIEGDYDNVVGFPWTRIQQELTRFD